MLRMNKLPQPIYTSLPESDALQLVEPYMYEEFGVHLDIPAGFIWDGASIPRMLWMSTGSNYDPDFTLPGLVHDYMYHSGTYSKKLADQIFLNELKRENVSFYTRYKMYYAVKFFGGQAWENHRQRGHK